MPTIPTFSPPANLTDFDGIVVDDDLFLRLHRQAPFSQLDDQGFLLNHRVRSCNTNPTRQRGPR